MARLQVAVLGPVEVHLDGVEIQLGTTRNREIVAALALSAGKPVSNGTLIARIWGDEAPVTALATLHGYISALRRRLEPDRPPRSPSTAIVTHGDAYALGIDPEDHDETHFERLVASARSRLAMVQDHLVPTPVTAGREGVETALDELEDALSLWRGTPYLELAADPTAVAHRARLADLHRTALELRAVGQLALGLHDVVHSDLEAQTAQYPLHERWWALRAVALARASRQAEALAVLDELRANLAEELGVDPSPPLQDLRTAILRQSPTVTSATAGSSLSGHARHAVTHVQTSPWKLSGRDGDLFELRRLLAIAHDERPAFAVITGEPGIGKSRLIGELVAEAGERDWHVAVGQCFEDDGAPPLWPWISVLKALDLALDLPEPGVEAGALFRVRAEIVRLLVDLSRARPLVLVLEDLHWADASTLGVLKLLIESTSQERLLVVGSWRPEPDPSRELRAVQEALARRHATTCDLTGLDESATQRLFEEVAGRHLGTQAASELHERTQGNPFYTVELARLARDDEREVEVLISGDTLPTAVTTVVERRLNALPEESVAVLRVAAVVGHRFDLQTLGDVTRIDADELLERVEPAVARGLLDEDGPEVFRFAHSLVWNVLVASTSATRLARTHRLLAELLDQRPGREAEVAWHWRNAGARHVGQAWRSTVTAAQAAADAHAYPDAAGLLREALVLQAADPGARPADELILLQQSIDAYRGASMLPELVSAVERSIAVAERAGDVEAMALAAIQTTHRMGWRSAPYGSVNETVTGALQRALDELPESKKALRSRVLVSLASELREEAPHRHRVMLCDEAVELARRSGSPRLLCDVLILSALATWGSPRTPRNLAAAAEAATLAQQLEDRHALLMAKVILTVAHGELGHVRQMWDSLATTRKDASDLRVVYAELTLDELELAWLAASGRFDACSALLVDIKRRLAAVGGDGRSDDMSLAAHFDLFAYQLWRGRPLDALPGLSARIEAGLPMHVFKVVALWRGGKHEEARAAYCADQLEELSERELGFSSALRCAMAEVALYLDDTGLAARAYTALSPYAGRSSGADGLFFGPVDAFLALAAHACGDTAAATAHADDALALMESWDLPAAREWFVDLRRRYDL